MKFITMSLLAVVLSACQPPEKGPHFEGRIPVVGDFIIE